MTNGVRPELAAQGTLVHGVLLGAADTGSTEVIVDDRTAMVTASLACDPTPFYEQMTRLPGTV